MLRLRQNQSQSPTQPQSSVNGLKFFHIIYLQPCQTRSWSKGLSHCNALRLVEGYWDTAQPPTKQFFDEGVSPYQTYFYPPRGDVPGKEYFFHINIYDV